MHKLLLPLLLVAGSATLSFGQSTLTAANFNPVAGDAPFIIKVCDTTGVTPGASGAHTTWNFTSTLHATSTDTGRAVPCTAAAVSCSSFPGSTLALKGPGYLNVTNYVAAGSTKLSQVGYWSAADTNLVMTDPMDQIRYPFTYGTSFVDTFSGMLTLSVAHAHHNGTISVTCDGFGTLMLPGRTDTGVLRVHSSQLFIDSTSLFGSPVLTSYTIESYDWYKAGYHSVLLTQQTVTQVGASSPTFRFVAYAAAQLTGVEDVANNIHSLELYPNPVQNELNIRFTATTGEQVRVSLYDMMGREVAVVADQYATGDQRLSYNTGSLPRGLYLLKVSSASQTTSRKIELQ